MSRLLWACILGGTLANGLARAGEEPAAVEQVVPVACTQFHAPQQPDDDYRRAAELVLHGARCNLAWAPGAAERIERQGTALSGRQNHDVIRPACAASCALAVALTTGIYDPRVTGIGRDEATARTVRLIRAAAGAHNRASWNYPWQSALWATTLSQAGWLLWDQLDPPTRRLIADIAQFEADRFLVPGYRVPYWNGKDGDTKAEENAWNSMVLQVAAAMMPRHAHAPGWRRVCSELMVSAYARPQDRQLDALLDGRPVKDWLHGYNAREDGAVINHGFLHPDYMCCVELKLRAEKLLARQSRHADRCVFTPEEVAHTHFPGSEQEVAWLCADAFLLQWLRACGALGAKGNWLDAHQTTAR